MYVSLYSFNLYIVVLLLSSSSPAEQAENVLQAFKGVNLRVSLGIRHVGMRLFVALYETRLKTSVEGTHAVPVRPPERRAEVSLQQAQKSILLVHTSTHSS